MALVCNNEGQRPRPKQREGKRNRRCFDAPARLPRPRFLRGKREGSQGSDAKQGQDRLKTEASNASVDVHRDLKESEDEQP